MKKYFTISMKKITSSEQFKNYLGHNTRERNYESENVDTSKSHLNIILKKREFKTDEEHVEYCNSKLSKGKRKTKKDSAHSFEIVIDCSKNHFKNEEEHLNYLKDSEKFLKERFKGQKILNSVIHMDEGKPHLHINFSYFNEEKGQWYQKELYKKKITMIDNLLNDFEKKVGEKYNLKKGDKEIDEENLTKKIKVNIKEKKMFGKEKEVIIDTPKSVNNLKNKYLRIQKELRKNENIIKEKGIKNLQYNYNFEDNKEKVLKLDPETFLIIEDKEKMKNGNYLISSPFREDNKKSFSIFFDNTNEIWLSHDLSTGETYNNIDLYMKLNKLDYKNTIKELVNEEKNLFKVSKTTLKDTNEEKTKKTTNPLENISIRTNFDNNSIDYLYSRNIKKFPESICRVEEKIDDKTFYGIGLKNNSGGYSFRNKYIKKNIGQNDLTAIDNKKDTTVICEGMFDYLSLYQTSENNVNYIILNSVNNLNNYKLEKVNNLIKDKKIITVLDNDNAGKKCESKIKNLKLFENCKIEKIYFVEKDYSEHFCYIKKSEKNKEIEVVKETPKEKVENKTKPETVEKVKRRNKTKDERDKYHRHR